MKDYIIGFLLLVLAISCSDVPCEDIDCNNGNCNDGICECEAGFSGSDCSDMLEPLRIRIVKIEVSSYPSADDLGNIWDEDDNSTPDLLYQIDQGPITSGIRGLEKANPESLPIEWIDNILLLPETNYRFVLFDVDENQEEEMLSFEFLSYNGERQATMSFSNVSYQIDFEIEYDF